MTGLHHIRRRKQCDFARRPGTVTVVATLIAVALGALLILQACRWYSRREFNPDSSEFPITFFSLYKLELEGLAAETHTAIVCHVSFLEPRDATGDIAKIPVFVVDSFCFESRCLNSSVCYGSLSEYEIFPKQPYLDEDLCTSSGRLDPVDYWLDGAPKLPPDCKGRDVSVTLKARLLDRQSRETIARESKRIQFVIKKKTRPAIGS